MLYVIEVVIEKAVKYFQSCAWLFKQNIYICTFALSKGGNTYIRFSKENE